MGAGGIQSDIASHCDRKGWPYNKLISCSRSGWPDCIVVIKGVTYYLEVKFGKDTVKSLQQLTRERLNEHYEISFVIRSFKDFLEIVERIERCL